MASPKGVTGQRHVIVLQPIGDFTRDELAVLGQLRAFTSAYFQLPVRVAKLFAAPTAPERSAARDDVVPLRSRKSNSAAQAASVK
jgi:hypothetical protein